MSNLVYRNKYYDKKLKQNFPLEKYTVTRKININALYFRSILSDER